MKSRRKLLIRCFIMASCVLIVTLGAGCSSESGNAPVNSAKARETLRIAMESWKNGETAESLQSASPPIYVIDMEWTEGTKLEDYQIMGDGEEKDAHLFCPVKLVFRDSKGKTQRAEVIYIISTAPSLTVSRKVF
jgi:hypothetical protein